jgi:hypothetical protein
MDSATASMGSVPATSSSRGSRSSIASGMKYIHTGYDAAGFPLAPRLVARAPRMSGPPTPAQMAARARLASGQSTAAWRAFVAARPGQNRDVTVMEWRATHPKRQHVSKGKEQYRYERLQRLSGALGLTPEWHSSRGHVVPRAVSARTGKSYPVPFSRSMLAGHPYGSVWREGSVLHGSGRVRG